MSKSKKPVLAKLSDLRAGDYADCFVQLADKTRKTLADGKPFFLCKFRDAKRTVGITPPKSNWALPIDTPPFAGFAVTCGITFTFGGLRIDPSARVLDAEDRPMPGLYAAGELVGGLFYFNYAGGSGLMAGAVFGKIAGESAARDLIQLEF